MTYQIRIMTREDCDQVYSLFEDCFAHPWSVDSIREMFSQTSYHNLVALYEGRVIGYIGVLTVMDEGDITNVAVSPDCRRQHVAERLLSGLIKEARDGGIRRIFLEVRRSNEPARRLYEKAGFIGTGIRKNYYDQPREDAVIMMWQDLADESIER